MPISKAQTVLVEPPDPDNLARWTRIASAGNLDDHPPGLVVEALRSMLPREDEALRSQLALHLSGVITRKLRRKVKTSYPDQGRAIIKEAHDHLCDAIFDATSPDGAAMVAHFDERLHFRFIDALRSFSRERQVEVCSLADEDGEERDADEAALSNYSSISVGHVLSLIKDKRKRLAFSLVMESHPRSDIAAAFGIDAKTLYRWIEEVRDFLKTELDL